MLVYREVCPLTNYASQALIDSGSQKEEQFFRAARVTRPYIVQPLLSVTTSSKPSSVKDHAFLLDVEVANVSQNADVVVSQVMTMSPLWTCQAVSEPAW